MRDMQQSRDTYATINLNSSLYNQTCTKPKNNKIQTEHSSTTSSQDWKQTHHNPPQLWCRILPLKTKTLNFLILSHINPRLSEEETLNVTFDYNTIQVSPPVTKIFLHKKPNIMKTWNPHVAYGWCLGTAPEHYRCHKIHTTKISADRFAKTFKFFLQNGSIQKIAQNKEATTSAR